MVRARQGAGRGTDQRRPDLDRERPAVAYALWNFEERGAMFRLARRRDLSRMIIGAHSRDTTRVHPAKGSSSQYPHHVPRTRRSADPADPDELEERSPISPTTSWAEVTPKAIRLRKRCSTPTTQRASRTAAASRRGRFHRLDETRALRHTRALLSLSARLPSEGAGW